MQLFFAGKLKVSGNQMLAMKLQKLFELGKS
jgi:putative sterol carrier protein